MSWRNLFGMLNSIAFLYIGIAPCYSCTTEAPMRWQHYSNSEEHTMSFGSLKWKQAKKGQLRMNLGSFNNQLFMSHLYVAVVTSVLMLLLTFFIPYFSSKPMDDVMLTEVVQNMIVEWQTGTPVGESMAVHSQTNADFGLIVAADGTVRYYRGNTSCTSGAALTSCAPTVQSRADGVRYLPTSANPATALPNERWVEVVVGLADGSQAIAHLSAVGMEDMQLTFVGLVIVGFWPSLLIYSLVVTGVTIPTAFVLTWLWARPMARRIVSITETSRRFAAGDLAARSNDSRDDEVGQLARQFDDMAETLAQNIGVLRDLAQQNAVLMRQNEEGAIQAERMRLARNLHDEIAQQLFSLNLLAAALPDQIEHEPVRAATQAKAVVALAEQAQMDLRTILLELRPAQVARQGLNEALQTLCHQWQSTHLLPIELEVVLSGRYLLAGVEDVIYLVTREALSNVAKHARATSVSVALVEGRQFITLSVTDDGGGFDPQRVSHEGHYGLAGMRERAVALGGSLLIESDTNRGTTLRLTVPLSPVARHDADPTEAA